VRALVVVALLLGCGKSDSTSSASPLDTLRKEHGLQSIALAVIRDGEVVYQQAQGQADDGTPAEPNTIYLLASVSKPIVGLAAARLMEASPDALDLDADVNEYLEWDPPLRHPQHPNTPLTLRHLMRHEGGIVANTDADYDTYPKPDPEGDLGAFLKPFLAQRSAWRSTAPGAQYHYSNVGVALAAHVIEVAADEDFEDLCQRTIFDPLGMNDTRWFYGDFSAAQQARVARPFDEDGAPYDHYGFDDWPSGQLRSSAEDMAKLLVMLADDGGTLMSAAAVGTFETVPLLVDNEGGVFSHSGGESGSNTYFEYDSDGNGYVVLVNSDLEDDSLEEMMDDVAALVQDLPAR
jgi:CubicO group peptidase (beta-lactamase class C family)